MQSSTPSPTGKRSLGGKHNLVEAVTLGGGFEADEPKTSGFFKLQKIRTRGKL